MPDVSSSIFISYSRQDQDYVKNLISAFEKRGLSVWLDDRIDYGSAWQQVIEEHLRACQVFVLVMTPRSYESHWVQCELSCALEMRKPIFPLLLEGERWFSVAAIQVVDVKSGAIPPNRFFQAVSASIIDLSIATTDSFTSSNPVDVGTKAPVQEIVRWQYLDVENELDALRREIAEPEIQRFKSVDARYADLERYLKNGQWEAADNETYRLMITEVGKKEGQWFAREDLLNFPCDPLTVIDGLWVDYSSRKFGFSVQKKMYVDECGGVPDGNVYHVAFNKLSEMNGWAEGHIQYDLEAPLGHLPCPSRWNWGWEGWIRREFIDDSGWLIDGMIFSRIQTCSVEPTDTSI
jgi:hypothetical protein